MRALKWIGAGVLALALLTGIVGGGALLYLRTGLPDTRGEIRIAGLEGEIEIVRDAFGVPHVWASSERDLWLALGFLHAQDRAVQLELVRLLGQGRVAEIVGPRALPIDRFYRALDLSRAARNAYVAASPELRQRADAYAAGVNAALASRDGAPPPEFLATGHKPERWESWQTLLWGQLMAMQLTGDWRDELFRLRLGERYNAELETALWPQWGTGDAAIVTQADPELAKWATAIAKALPRPAGPDQASNTWIAGGAKTATGKPILASDPHLGLGAPGQWYLARLAVTGTDIVYAGATAPGAPALVLGHNGRIAWGFTTTNADTADLTIERVAPANPALYLTPEGPRAFELREEVFQARGAAPVTLTMRRTRNGIVISDFDAGAASAAPNGELLALMLPVIAAPDTTADAIVRLNRANNVAEAFDATRQWLAPVQNMSVADRNGTIGLRVVGAIPLRNGGDSPLPKRGWTGASGWQGFVPFDRMPARVDPANARLSNGNDRVVGSEWPFYLGRSFDAPFRQKRIVEMLDLRGGQTPAYHEAMLADAVSVFARDAIAAASWLSPVEPRARAALERLRAWDNAVRADKPEGLIFNVWVREMTRRLTQNALGDLAADFGRERPRMVLDALNRNSPYCAGDCPKLVSDSLVATIEWIETRHGRSLDRWRWGDEHNAPFDNPVLSRLPLIGWFLSVDIPTDGDYFTVNRGANSARDPDRPFAHIHGAGYRAVYDLADLDASLFVVAPGQSGHPLSAHWADLAPIWASGRHLRLARNRAELGSDADILRLAPPQ